MIVKEHNRIPGKVNYDFPQTFYSTFPEIDQEAYVTLGNSSEKRVHMAWDRHSTLYSIKVSLLAHNTQHYYLISFLLNTQTLSTYIHIYIQFTHIH